MTFDEFWEKNYAKDFGNCEPYHGIASHAFEAGQQNCGCVHTDNSAVIERLQKQIEKMKCCYNCKYWNEGGLLCKNDKVIIPTYADYCCEEWEMKQ